MLTGGCGAHRPALAGYLPLLRRAEFHQAKVLERGLDPGTLLGEESGEPVGRLVKVDPAALPRNLLPFGARGYRGHGLVELLLFRRLQVGLGEDGAPIDDLDIHALLLES